MDIKQVMIEKAQLVNDEIERLLPNLWPSSFYQYLRGSLRTSSARIRPSFAVSEPIKHVVEAGGKRVRPTLCLLACEAVGGDCKKALPTAVAIELIHTFTLVHDDIMDGDILRRGKPTVHAIWGEPVGIAVGDALFSLAFQAIGQNAKVEGVQPSQVIQILDMASDVCLKICQGQTMDILFENRDDITVDEYMEMIRLKTGILLEFSLQAGALLGGGTEEQIKTIGNFGIPLGEAFQIKDDVLNLTVSEETLGKPMGSDIVAGKRTLIMVHGLQYAQEKDKERLREIIHTPEKKLKERAVKEAIEILHRAGSIEYAKSVVDELTKEAYHSLDVLPKTKGREALEALHAMAEYMMLRDY